MTPLEELQAAVEAAAADLRDGAAPLKARPTLERPRKAGFGDFSTNAAMLLAPALGEPPRTVAERLGAALQDRLGGRVERVEVAGPGFLNMFLSDAWYLAAVDHVLAAGDAFGAGSHGERVQVPDPDTGEPVDAINDVYLADADALERGERTSTLRDIPASVRTWSVMNSGPVPQLRPTDSGFACSIEA